MPSLWDTTRMGSLHSTGSLRSETQDWEWEKNGANKRERGGVDGGGGEEEWARGEREVWRKCVCGGEVARGKVQCNSLRKFPMHFAHIFLGDLSLLYMLYKLLSFRESASKKEKPWRQPIQTMDSYKVEQGEERGRSGEEVSEGSGKKAGKKKWDKNGYVLCRFRRLCSFPSKKTTELCLYLPHGWTLAESEK